MWVEMEWGGGGEGIIPGRENQKQIVRKMGHGWCFFGKSGLTVLSRQGSGVERTWPQ